MRRLILVPAFVLSNCNIIFPYQPDQLCKTQIRAVCHYAFACCNAAEREVIGGFFGLGVDVSQFRNETECLEESFERNGACGNAYVVADAVAGKRFQYDQVLAEKCTKPTIDALNSCSTQVLLDLTLDGPDKDCKDVQGFAFGKGLVKDKDPCFAAFECAEDDSICDIDDDDPFDNETTVTAVGECQAPLKEGDDCVDDEDPQFNGFCEKGTFCDFVDEECKQIEVGDKGDPCFQDIECCMR
jgi:hypothetical protein